MLTVCLCLAIGGAVLCQEGWCDTHPQSWRSSGLKYLKIMPMCGLQYCVLVRAYVSTFFSFFLIKVL